MTKIVKWEPSPLKNKKYRVTLSNGKHVDFGAAGMAQFQDKTPLQLYSHLDHNDPDRRKRYRARHSKILLKDDTPAYKKKYSASWLSWRFLWN